MGVASSQLLDKCSYAKYSNMDLHQIFDLCVVDPFDQSGLGNQSQYVCQIEHGRKKIYQVYYSDEILALCDDTHVTHMIDKTHLFDQREIYCEPREECDYIQFGEWKQDKTKPCDKVPLWPEKEYRSTEVLTTLDVVGKCMVDEENGSSMGIIINSCGYDVPQKRVIIKNWLNKNCEGPPYSTHEIYDQGENNYPDDEGYCTRWLSCSTPDIVNMTINSADITNTKFAMLCVFIMVIQQIFCLV